MSRNSLFFVAVILLISVYSCSSGGNASDIAKSLADRLTDQLDVDGGQLVEGSPPDGTDSEEAPQINDISGDDLRLGAPFAFALKSDFEKPNDVSEAIIYVSGASNYIVVSGELVARVFDILGTLGDDETLQGEDFEIRFALRTSSGITGLYKPYGLTVTDTGIQRFENSEAVFAVTAENEVENHTSDRPPGSSRADVPQITDIEAPGKIKPGDAFTVILSTDFTAPVNGVILTTPGNDAWKEIAAQAVDGKVTVKGQLTAENLELGDRLVFQWALQGAAGVGAYRSWSVEISEETGDGDVIDGDTTDGDTIDGDRIDGDSESITPDGDDERLIPDGDEDIETSDREDTQLSCASGPGFCDDNDPNTVGDYCLGGECVGQRMVAVGTACNDDIVCGVNRWCDHSIGAEGECRQQFLSGSAGGIIGRWSQTGKVYVVASGSQLRVWETAGWFQIRTFAGHTDDITALDISIDSNLVATSGKDGQILVWRIADGELIFGSAIGDPALSVAISTDSAIVSGGYEDGKIRSWRLGDGSELPELPGHNGGTLSLDFAPDGTLVSGGNDNALRHWQLDNQTELHVEPVFLSPVNSVAVSPDGVYVAGAATGSGLSVWKTADWFPALLRDIDNILSVTFAPSSAVVAVGLDNGDLFQWKIADGVEAEVFSISNQLITSVAYSPIGDLISGCTSQEECAVWNISTREMLVSFPGHGGSLTNLDFASDGSGLAAAYGRGIVHEINPADAGIRAVFDAHIGPATAVAFSPDNGFIATGGQDGSIKMWPIAGGNPLGTFTGPTGGVSALAISPDSSLMAAGSIDGQLMMWRISDGAEFQNFTAHTGSLSALAFSPDSKAIATAGSDGSAKLFRVSDAQTMRSFSLRTPINALAFSPDGTRIATAGDDQNIHIWNAGNGTEIDVYTGQGAVISALAYSPRGDFIASGGQGAAIMIRNAENGDPVTSMDWLRPITALAFSPKGAWLAAGSEDRDTGSHIPTLQMYDIGRHMGQAEPRCRPGECEPTMFCNLSVRQCVLDGCQDSIDNDDDGLTDDTDPDCSAGGHMEYRNDVR